MRLSTTKQRRRVTLQVSKPQSQKIRTSGQITWENGYQKNTKQLLCNELKQGRYPRGGQAKHLESTLKQRLKQCNKAADSWATTACKHRLGAIDAGGPGFQTATQASQRPPLREEAAGTSCRPKGTARAVWQGQTAQAHKDPLLQETHCSPTRLGSGC